MMEGKFQLENLKNQLSGQFTVSIKQFITQLSCIEAFVFDWDGVFNNGIKGGDIHSTFSEADAMGINMLRFSYWLANNKTLPKIVIVTGEKNPVAHTLTEREHFDALFFRIGNKIKALEYLGTQFNLSPSSIAFSFDDILDLGMSKKVGVRCLISRKATPFFTQYVTDNQLCDYITGNEGGNHGVREVTEIFSLGMNQFENALSLRSSFSPIYKEYLMERDKITPLIFTQNKEKNIISYN